MDREGSSRIAKAPPGWGEKAMRRLKEQYPGHPEKAFATAWSLHKRDVSGEDYLSGKSSSRSAAPASYARMLDEIVGAVCEPIIREAKRRQLKKKTRGRCVFPAESSSVTDDKDHFPINSLAQARNALARVMQYDACPGWYKGSLKGLQGAVRREVYGQFPGLKSRKEEREANRVAPQGEVGPVVAKQPWEMTQVFVNSQRAQDAFPLNTTVSTKTGKPVWTHSTTVQWDGAPRTFEITQGRSPMPPNIIDRLHKKVIEAAISEGKPVPREVLVDYPDLANPKR